MKRKNFCGIVLAIIIAFIPVIHVRASTNVMKIIPVSLNADIRNAIIEIDDFLEKTPFSQELFRNYLNTINGKDVMAYWEEDVDSHIKNGIIENVYYQNMLQDVLKLAYQNGHYKIDFISDNTPPAYYEPSFDETRYNQQIEFNEGDLYYAIHGVNGHVVIDATYLGNNQFEVWVALQDYYDFAFDKNCNYGILCNATNYLYLQKEINNIGHEFYTTIGFTYTCTWEPDTTSNKTDTNETIESNGSASNIPKYVTNQYYSRGEYDIGYYTGEWNGKPNGNGTLNYNSSTKYKIEMPDGKIYYATTYTGNWVNGKKYGTGIFTYSNGIRYEGIWNVDGYYFKGYIVYPTYKRYIEQIANGDEIKTVRSDDPIYNNSIDYQSKQNIQTESLIKSVEEGEFICEYTINKIPVYESATSSNIRYYIINNSRNNVYKMICNKKYILQDGTIRYSKSAGSDIEYLDEPNSLN